MDQQNQKLYGSKEYIKRNWFKFVLFKICSRGEKGHEMKTNSVPSFLHGHFRYWLDLARACRTRLCTHHPRRAIVHTWTKQCSSTCHRNRCYANGHFIDIRASFCSTHDDSRIKHTHTMPTSSRITNMINTTQIKNMYCVALACIYIWRMKSMCFKKIMITNLPKT